MIASQCAQEAISLPVAETTEEVSGNQGENTETLRTLNRIPGSPGFPSPDSARTITANYGPSFMTMVEQFLLPQKGYLDVYIVDDQGQHILQIFSGPIDKTQIVILWNGTMPDGGAVPSGVYRLQVEMGEKLYAADVFYENSGGSIIAGGNVASGFDDEAWDYPPTPQGGYALITYNVRSQYSGEIPRYVTTLCEIDPDGSVGTIGDLRAPLATAFPQELQTVIRSVIQKTRWEPALKNNQPVTATVRVPIFTTVE